MVRIKTIFENNNFIAVNKPPGLLVHPSPHTSKTEKTLIDFIIKKYPEIASVGDKSETSPGHARHASKALRAGIVHRLDRYTSGIIIVARTQAFFDYFKELLKKRKVKKTYLALVWGEIMERGAVNAPMGLISGTTKRAVVNPTGNNRKLKMIKSAATKYRPLKIIEKAGEKFTFLELYPETGRTHQLRVHMKSIHHPIAGDGMYGKRENPFNLERLFLHAKSLEFKNLSGERIYLEAPLAEDLKIVF